MLGMTGAAVAGTAAASTVASQDDDSEDGGNGEECEGPGYSDTPQLPDSEYVVHDPCRPQPDVVDPGEPAFKRPPSDATVLLDAACLAEEMALEAWEHPDGGGAAEWNVTDDYVEVEPETGPIRTTEEFGDAQIHLEWSVPTEVEGEDQEPGNSGVFLASQYEIQILDSYENVTYADGHAGAVYGQYPPLVNASRPQGEWQTYDIIWTAPRFSNGELESPAEVTLLWNGVVVQNNVELIGPVAHRDIADYEPHPPEQPLELQDHGQPVRFRNIWYRSL